MWTVASYKELMRSSSDVGKLARASDSNELIKLLCFATADCRVWPHLRHHLIWLMLTTFYQETVMTTLWRHISVINPLDLTNPIYSVICSMLFSTFSHCAPLPGLVFLALSYIRPPPHPSPAGGYCFRSVSPSVAPSVGPSPKMVSFTEPHCSKSGSG